VLRRLLTCCTAFVALSCGAAPALATLLQLDCPMVVGKRDALHPRNYRYAVTLDEDAGRASDDAGAYELWRNAAAPGFVWYNRWPSYAPATWETQYVLDDTKLLLSARDAGADPNQDGFSTGLCTAVVVQ
jgi:hypothetical protein